MSVFYSLFSNKQTQGKMNSCQRSHNEGSRHPVVRPNQHTEANISLVKYWTLIQRDENKSILPSMLDCLFKFVRKSDSIPADFFFHIDDVFHRAILRFLHLIFFIKPTESFEFVRNMHMLSHIGAFAK